jgi:phage terminase large subunit
MEVRTKKIDKIFDVCRAAKTRYVFCEGGTRCLTGETLVKTINGYIPIKDINPGDVVYSLNEEKGIVLNRIVDKFCYKVVQPKDKMIIFISDNFKIRCTYEHKFRINGKWIKAIDLARRAMENPGQSLCDIYSGEVSHVSQTQTQFKTHSESRINESSSQSGRVFENSCLGKNNTNTQNGCRSVYSESREPATNESQERYQNRQSNRESGMGNYFPKCKTRLRYWISKTIKRSEKWQFQNNRCESETNKGNIQTKELQQGGIYQKRRYINSYSERYVAWQDLGAHPMEARIEPLTETVYDIEVENDHNFLITKQNIVSHNSGKTYSMNQVLFSIAAEATKPTVISIVSETMPHLKRGAMRDFFNWLIQCEIYNPKNHNKSDNSYRIDDSIIEFFSADSPDKVHGPERDYLFVNEVQNIKYEIFFHLAQRTRVRVFADWNPTEELFVHTKFLNDPQYKDDITYIHSTIFDNPFVSEEIKKDVLRRANVDDLYRTVYLEGKIGIREGLIFKNWHQVDRLPERGAVRFGLDFGYTNDPSTLIKVVETDDGRYVDEMFYQTEMLNRDIVKAMKRMNVRENYDEIIADSAEPKSIQEIKDAGFNIKGAEKGQDSIRAGIDRIKSKQLFVTKRSINIIKELRNYSWVMDKDGKPTNKPIDGYNHACDAIRYATEKGSLVSDPKELQGMFF